ncbi:hypothetical protein GPOL_c31550 [Gordonia polyisoprenivorans VH2]|uniref:Uncharacterized protein n=1 Tax=Gordonia polyisoprenivorans (strain DSM 44266 / VH2) TaxID=1112204 RepID=H6MWG5_GORPV|nr:hypothetical protein GPOL_c31550 [Gordonia polyisoprenivorans VH2]
MTPAAAVYERAGAGVVWGQRSVMSSVLSEPLARHRDTRPRQSPPPLRCRPHFYAARAEGVRIGMTHPSRVICPRSRSRKRPQRASPDLVFAESTSPQGARGLRAPAGEGAPPIWPKATHPCRCARTHRRGRCRAVPSC